MVWPIRPRMLRPAQTVYAQQCRALTLVHALLEMGELKQDGRLAVIGGGAAGVMAAAAAATKEVNVILFERAENLLPLQRQNTKRYLHPHVYDWPAAGSLESCASLPLLDWQADLSNHVAAQIVNGLQHVREHTGRIDIRVGQTVQDLVRVSDSDQTDRIQIIGSEGDINELVDTAIIAIGFGVEPRHRLCVATPPYWEDDGLGQTLGASRDRPHRILCLGQVMVR